MTTLKEVMPSYITEESFLQVVEPLFRSIGIDIDDILTQNPEQNQSGQPPQQPVPGQEVTPAGPQGLPPQAAPQPLPPAQASPDQINQNLNSAPTPIPTTNVES